MKNNTLRQKRLVIDWLRKSRVMVENKDSLLDPEQLKLVELEESLRFAIANKRELHVQYEAIFRESKFKEQVRFYYKKNGYYHFIGEDRKEADYWEHQLLKSFDARNSNIRRTAGFQGNQFKNEYHPYKINGRAFRFVPDEAHLDMLNRLEEINQQSRNLIEIIASLKAEIEHKKSKKRVLHGKGICV